MANGWQTSKQSPRRKTTSGSRARQALDDKLPDRNPRQTPAPYAGADRTTDRSPDRTPDSDPRPQVEPQATLTPSRVPQNMGGRSRMLRQGGRTVARAAHQVPPTMMRQPGSSWRGPAPQERSFRVDRPVSEIVPPATARYVGRSYLDPHRAYTVPPSGKASLIPAERSSALTGRTSNALNEAMRAAQAQTMAAALDGPRYPQQISRGGGEGLIDPIPGGGGDRTYDPPEGNFQQQSQAITNERPGTSGNTGNIFSDDYHERRAAASDREQALSDWGAIFGDAVDDEYLESLWDAGYAVTTGGIIMSREDYINIGDNSVYNPNPGMFQDTYIDEALMNIYDGQALNDSPQQGRLSSLYRDMEERRRLGDAEERGETIRESLGKWRPPDAPQMDDAWVDEQNRADRAAAAQASASSIAAMMSGAERAGMPMGASLGAAANIQQQSDVAVLQRSSERGLQVALTNHQAVLEHWRNEIARYRAAEMMTLAEHEKAWLAATVAELENKARAAEYRVQQIMKEQASRQFGNQLTMGLLGAVTHLGSAGLGYAASQRGGGGYSPQGGGGYSSQGGGSSLPRVY